MLIFKHFPIHFLVKNEWLNNIMKLRKKKKRKKNLVDFKKLFTKEMMAFKNLSKMTIDDLP